MAANFLDSLHGLDGDRTGDIYAQSTKVGHMRTPTTFQVPARRWTTWTNIHRPVGRTAMLQSRTINGGSGPHLSAMHPDEFPVSLLPATTNQTTSQIHITNTHM